MAAASGTVPAPEVDIVKKQGMPWGTIIRVTLYLAFGAIIYFVYQNVKNDPIFKTLVDLLNNVDKALEAMAKLCFKDKASMLACGFTFGALKNPGAIGTMIAGLYSVIVTVIGGGIGVWKWATRTKPAEADPAVIQSAKQQGISDVDVTVNSVGDAVEDGSFKAMEERVDKLSDKLDEAGIKTLKEKLRVRITKKKVIDDGVEAQKDQYNPEKLAEMKQEEYTKSNADMQTAKEIADELADDELEEKGQEGVTPEEIEEAGGDDIMPFEAVG